MVLPPMLSRARMSNKKISVGLLLFDEVEVLDFAGPFEVFSLAENRVDQGKIFQVHTISERPEAVSARNGLKVQADFRFDNHPELEVLIVPGGYGAEQIEIHNKRVLQWIKKQAGTCSITASVCTGAFLLAASGVLTDQQVTTHHLDQGDLQKQFPSLKVLADKKFVDAGRVVTSGGISAGITMSLYLVARIAGREVAEATARRMEYDWSPNP